MRHLLIVAGALAMTGCVTESVYLGSDKPVVEKRINNEDAARTRISLALKYLSTGDSSQAKYNLERAAVFAPKLPEVHYSTAYYYSAVGEVELAKKSYLRAIELAPDDPNTLNNYGVFLCGNGQYDEAQEYLLAAIAIPSYIRVAESYENLALCAIENDEFGDAQEYLESSVKHSPLRSSSLINLSALYYAKSDLIKAQDLLARYEDAGRVSSRSLLLSYLIDNKMGHIQKAELTGKVLQQTYFSSREALVVRENKVEDSEFEQLRQQYRKSELRKIQKTVVREVEQPKIKIIKRKSPAQEEGLTDSSKQPQIVNAPLIKVDAIASEPAQPFIETSLQPTAPVQSSESEVDSAESVSTLPPLKSNSDIEQTIADRQALGLIELPFHEVKKGETLFSISVRYNVKLQKLLEWNGLAHGDQVNAGTKVYLNDPNVYHRVVEGDTLFGISVKYNILMKKLLEWNELSFEEHLTPGRKILLVDPKTYSL